MTRLLTTSDLVNEVRSLIDETNSESIDNVRDIIPALNRAQDVAANILAGHYESPLLVYTTIPLVGGQKEYDIPHDAFEMRLEKLEVQIQNGLFNPLKRQSYRDTTLLETTARTSYPLFYAEIGQKFRLFPSPTGAFPLRCWYLKDPEPLVLEQGTVTIVNQAGNYVVVDNIGSDLTVANDSTDSYVNFVDWETGRIKGTCQIQVLTDNKITFKTSPTRATVHGLTVSGSLPSDLEPEDLICTAEGICISVLKKPFANYLIQMAVSELLNTKLGMTSEMGEKMRQEMQKIVERSWVGREAYLRVRSASPHWERIGRRYGNRF